MTPKPELDTQGEIKMAGKKGRTKPALRTSSIAAGRPPALYSMTGYGRAGGTCRGVMVEVEIKSLNHRYLDVSAKLPRMYNEFEGELRALIGRHLERGRVEFFAARRVVEHGACELRLNRRLFSDLTKLYAQAMQLQGVKAGEKTPWGQEIKSRIVMEVLRRGDVLEIAEDSAVETKEKEFFLRLARRAVEALNLMRRKEGAVLVRDISARLAGVRQVVAEIEKLSHETPAAMKSRLLGRVSKLAPEVRLDESRLAMEVAVLAERVDVTEEIVRLKSHLTQFKQSLEQQPSGRRFDFILQEMNRELNTICAKAQNGAVQTKAISVKLELEKLREQVQNIE